MKKDFNGKKLILVICSLTVYIFAIIGLIFVGVYFAMKFKLTNEQGGIDSLSAHYNEVKIDAARKNEIKQIQNNWETSEEWQVITAGLLKDKETILRASEYSGVPARMIVASVIAEQFRFFNSNRENFKKYLLPLGILGNGTQFSYGIAGIKTETAMDIEANLKDITSPYYLGSSYEQVLDFTSSDVDAERMTRLTNPKDHYFSYVYAGLFLKEIMAQWERAGYSIENRPEILATLFNIGFAHSIPNAQPQTGGSTFTVNETEYTFGGIAYEFYYSDQLVTDFPN